VREGMVEEGVFWKKPRIDFWFFMFWDDDADFFNSGTGFWDGVDGLAFAIVEKCGESDEATCNQLDGQC
jgi:hypothetical protein